MGACTYKKEAIDRPAAAVRFARMPALARSPVYVFCVYHRTYTCVAGSARGEGLRVRDDVDVDVAGAARVSCWISPFNCFVRHGEGDRNLEPIRTRCAL
jgi:hypothetical protein